MEVGRTPQKLYAEHQVWGGQIDLSERLLAITAAAANLERAMAGRDGVDTNERGEIVVTTGGFTQLPLVREPGQIEFVDPLSEHPRITRRKLDGQRAHYYTNLAEVRGHMTANPSLYYDQALQDAAAAGISINL